MAPFPDPVESKPLSGTTLKVTLGGPPAQSGNKSHPGTEHSSWAALRHLAETLTCQARRKFFSKHSYNFIMEGICNLSEIFKQMVTSTELLGTSIYEIKVSWMGPDELKQANYALRSLPKGLKFLHVVPPSKSPKDLGLVGIHDPDALCCFSGITHCSQCGKEGQNKGTVVNHLWTVHYRLGLVCDRCHDCPSTMANTLCHHGWQDCHQPRERNPNESVSSE